MKNKKIVDPSVKRYQKRVYLPVLVPVSTGIGAKSLGSLFFARFILQ